MGSCAQVRYDVLVCKHPCRPTAPYHTPCGVANIKGHKHKKHSFSFGQQLPKIKDNLVLMFKRGVFCAARQTSGYSELVELDAKRTQKTVVLLLDYRFVTIIIFIRIAFGTGRIYWCRRNQRYISYLLPHDKPSNFGDRSKLSYRAYQP